MKSRREDRLLGVGLMLLFPALGMAWLGWLAAIGFVVGIVSAIMAAVFVAN
jgi:hypothetical protein